MTTRSNFYAVEITAAENGRTEISRFFFTIAAARSWANWCAGQPFFSKVRIMKGGQGGIEVR